jgi:hypothetical protein
MSTNVPITVAHGDGIGLRSWRPRSTSTAQKANGDGRELTTIDNRGVQLWPDGISETLLTDPYRCRFTASSGAAGYTLSQGQ